jgi:hypothetical protein
MLKCKMSQLATYLWVEIENDFLKAEYNMLNIYKH